MCLESQEQANQNPSKGKAAATAKLNTLKSIFSHYTALSKQQRSPGSPSLQGPNPFGESSLNVWAFGLGLRVSGVGLSGSSTGEKIARRRDDDLSHRV